MVSKIGLASRVSDSKREIRHSLATSFVSIGNSPVYPSTALVKASPTVLAVSNDSIGGMKRGRAY